MKKSNIVFTVQPIIGIRADIAVKSKVKIDIMVIFLNIIVFQGCWLILGGARKCLRRSDKGRDGGPNRKQGRQRGGQSGREREREREREDREMGKGEKEKAWR